VQVAVLPFRLDNNQSAGFFSRIAVSDKAVLLLSRLRSDSFLAFDKLETFGNVYDYALAFLGGFGLNATTSGFSAAGLTIQSWSRLVFRGNRRPRARA
jgi:hypothetical protein